MAGDDASAAAAGESLLRGVRRLRLILLTGLGDVVHGLPVVNAIRRAHPGIHITWVVEPMPAGLLAHHPAIDRVVVFEKRRGWRGVRDLARKLHSGNADLTLNLNIYFKSVFPLILNASPVRLGFDRARSRDGTWLFANRHLPARPRAHTQDMFLEFLEPLGVPARPIEWRLAPTAEEEQESARFFARALAPGEPAVAIVTASANAKKDWVAERYIELVDRLYTEHGLRSLLIGGPGGRETAVARMIVERARAPVIHALGDGVRRLIWLIRGSRLLIAPDTGPVHIARALGVPVIGLYGHTNPWRVGPWRWCEDLWIDAYTEPGTAPDPANFTPRLGRMEHISVDAVLERVAPALRKAERTGG
jgi:heptosyltransferase I